MVGDDDQKALKGYCRFSCGACSPSAASGTASHSSHFIQQCALARLDSRPTLAHLSILGGLRPGTRSEKQILNLKPFSNALARGSSEY